MSRPRVWILTKTTAMGGAERLLANALPHLDREAFEYRLLAFDAAGPLAAACAEAAVPFECVPRPGVLDPRNLTWLRRRLAAERVALLHAHLPLVGSAARLAAHGGATRLVYTEHNTPAGYARASHWLNRVTWALQDGVVAVSERVRAETRRAPRRARGRLTVVPNGVDADRLAREAARPPDPPLPAEPSDAFVALVPATLAHRKGQDVLLRALARLGADAARERSRHAAGGRPLRAWLAGDGPAEAALRREAARLGVAGQVRFLGRRADIFPLMARADAVVMPSRTEGHPLALLEAMALGRPVLATAVGGVPEVVASGHTGLLVPAEDPGALAAALTGLRDDPQGAAARGLAAAGEVRRRFDIRASVRTVEALYRACLAGRPASAPSPLLSGPTHPLPEENSCTGPSTPSPPRLSPPSPSSAPPAW